MRFITITIFAVAGRLVTLATAKPVPDWTSGGMAIPLTKHSPLLHSNKSIDIRDAISSHGRSIGEKILSGLDNYEMNTGTVHPFAVKRSESRLRERGASIPMTDYRNYIWMGEISIGTPPKTLKVHIDTGSADMWVLETGCGGICGDRDLWDPESTESAEYVGSFQLKYEDGTIVKGDKYADNVTIGGSTADPQTFGSATSYSFTLHNNEYPADGLLGLAFPSISKLGVHPLLASLAKQNRLIIPTFSLKLSSSGAEMYLGGANSMLYSGDIAYTRVTYPGFWQVSMDDVRVNGNQILKNVHAIIDTGANFIFGDRERVSKLYSRLGGTLNDNQGFGFYYLPCNSFPTLSLTFGGRTFVIPPEVLRLGPMEEGSPNCFSAIIAEHPEAPISEILLPKRPLWY